MSAREFRIEVAGTTYPVIVLDRESNVVDSFNREYLYGLDIETCPMFPYRGGKLDRGGLDRYLSEIRTIQIFDGHTVRVFTGNAIPGTIYGINRGGLRFVAHNAMFELQHLSSIDGLSGPEIGCTQLMDRLVLGAERDIENAKKADSAALAASCKRWLGIEVDKELQGSDWSGELSREQVEYAAKDAVYTWLLAHKLFPRIVKTGQENVYRLNRLAQKPCVEMMLNGMAFDTATHDRLIASWQARHKKAEEALFRLLRADINLNSTKQLTEWVRSNLSKDILSQWPQTASDKNDYLQFNADSLTHLRRVPFVDRLLEYKKLQKRLTTYGEPFRKYINPITGRVHCGAITLCETKTGRTSARNPNMQNIPRPEHPDDLSMKDCFTADSGNVLIGADYSQIELRVAAELSGDPVMRSAFLEDVDLHRKIAALISGIPEQEITKDSEERQAGKIFNYSLLFGAGARSTAHRAKREYGVDMTLEEAEKGVEAFRTLYPVYRTWQLLTTEAAKDEMLSRTPVGRLRRLPKEGWYTRSLNTPIQGGAGEVILTALVELQTKLGGLARIVNCVHDEILIEAPERYAQTCKGMLEESMVAAWERIFPGAPSKDLVDARLGRNWRECK